MAISIRRQWSDDIPDDTYVVKFFNDEIYVTVTHNPKCVSSWIDDIIRGIDGWRCSCCGGPSVPNRTIIGLDIEWVPNFKGGGGRNPVALLQLCIGGECLIFQLQYAHQFPISLLNFLGNSEYTFVGVGIEEDAQKLLQDYNLVVSNTVDLRDLASWRLRRPELGNVSLTALAREVIGAEYHKPKKITVSKWDNSSLSDAQVQYACIDAFLSFSIGLSLDADEH